jgi:hypothetical protein
LKLAQFGGVFFALATQTAFLDLEVAKLLFVGEKGFEIDEAGANCGIFVGKLFGKFVAAASVDGHFESGDALQAPIGIGKRLDESGFAQTDGAEFGLIVLNVTLILSGIVCGEQHGATS